MTEPARPSLPPAVAVIGAGSFGRHHLRIYAELAAAGCCRLVAVVDASEGVRAAATAQHGVAAFATIADMLAALAHRQIELSAASICVPTVHHAAAARELLHARVDVLVEKPFAATLAEADDLLALAAACGRLIAVGHLERFNPAVAAALAVRNRPMFFESHRLSVFTPRSLDVDVVLDLMVHDLDVVLAFAQSPVTEVRAVGLPVLSRSTDIANVRVAFASGAVANFTASRVSTEQVRKLRFFQPGEYISLDFARQEMLRIQVDPTATQPQTTVSSISGAASSRRSAETLAVPAPAPQTTHPTPGLHLTKPEIARAEPLRLELEDFLNAVTTRTPPRVPGEAGRAALALALAINEAILSHTSQAGL